MEMNMDQNTNRDEAIFLVMDAKMLWETAVEKENLQFTDSSISLQFTDHYVFEDTFQPGVLKPKSLALDACGTLFILEDGIYTYDPASPSLKPDKVHCLCLSNPVSLAVTPLDIVVIQEGSVSCLARCNYQIRWESRLPENEHNYLKIARSQNEQLYVLHTNEKKVYQTGREWKLQEETKIPLSDELQNPLDIASDREHNIYILDMPGAPEKPVIYKFSPQGKLLEEIRIPFEQEAEVSNLAVESSDNIFLVYYLEEAQGDPLTAEMGILQLKKVKQYQKEAVCITPWWDSTLLDCTWHKIVLDADIPANTSITVMYYASNDELTYVTKENYTHPVINPADALLVKAKGRYIRFRIDIKSDEMANKTPVIKSLKAYFPRNSYLRYLPAVYQEDEESKEFLERYLSLFETFLTGTEESIFGFTRYLDVFGTPASFISWLSSWLAIAYDENWSLEKKRILLKLAPWLYKMRGTRQMIAQLIKIYCGREPIIVEKFHFKCVKEPEILELLKTLYGCSSTGFCVLIKPLWEKTKKGGTQLRIVTETEQNTIRRIIDTEKPAHTSGGLQVLQPWFYLDMHTYLGINTILSEPRFILGKTSVIGRDTLLFDKEEAGRVGINSRVGIKFKAT